MILMIVGIFIWLLAYFFSVHIVRLGFTRPFCSVGEHILSLFKPFLTAWNDTPGARTGHYRYLAYGAAMMNTIYTSFYISSLPSML